VPEIKLSDNFGLSLDFEPAGTSGFGRYLRNPLLLRTEAGNLARLGQLELSKVGLEEARIGFNSQQAVPLEETRALIRGGAAVTMELEKTPETVLSTRIQLSATGGAAAGNFGFQAGAQMSLANYRPFAPETKFGDALRALWQGFTIPAAVKDIETVGPGVKATLGGRGTLKVSASIAIPVTPNPMALAEATLPVVGRKIEVMAGGKLRAGVSVEISGDYEISLERKDPDTVKVGFSRGKGIGASLSLSGVVGIKAGFGETDLIAPLLGAVSPNAAREVKALRDAGNGLPRQRAKEIEAAIRAGVSRRMEIALGAQLSKLTSDQQAFLYEVRPAELDDKGRGALTQALRGDLSGLDQQLSGIRLVRSIFTDVETERRSLQVNLLGIYNYISVSELTLKGQILVEETTGDLVITDTATAKRFQGVVDLGGLRRLMSESFLTTVAYRSADLAPAPEVEIKHSYFELLRKTSGKDLKDNLDVAEALMLLTPAEKNAALESAKDFGRTAFTVETSYGAEASSQVFSSGGQPRPEADFQMAGRKALALLIQPGEEFDYRREIASDSVWQQCTTIGNVNAIAQQLRTGKIRNDQQARVVGSDYILILEWAQAMAKAAQELARMKAVVQATEALDPEEAGFKKQRQEVAGSLKKVAGKTRERWGDPWGLVSMALVPEQSVAARVRITGPDLDLEYRRGAALVQSA